MRALVTALLAAPLLLAACGDNQDVPTGPATVPDVIAEPAMAAARSAAIDPSHTYRFETTCSAGAGKLAGARQQRRRDRQHLRDLQLVHRAGRGVRDDVQHLRG